jgi:hypothetical protein
LAAASLALAVLDSLSDESSLQFVGLRGTTIDQQGLEWNSAGNGLVTSSSPALTKKVRRIGAEIANAVDELRLRAAARPEPENTKHFGERTTSADGVSDLIVVRPWPPPSLNSRSVEPEQRDPPSEGFVVAPPRRQSQRN